MKVRFVLAVFILFTIKCSAQDLPSSNSEGGSQLNEEPHVFAPGVISGAAHDSAPAFAPSGDIVYFGRGNPNLFIILNPIWSAGSGPSRKSRPFQARGMTWSQPCLPMASF